MHGKRQADSFSLAVSGTGRTMDRFVALLRSRYPAASVYDRHAEATRDDSQLARPPHPEVADIDAVFGFSGPREAIMLRSRLGHRYYQFISDPAECTAQQLDRVLNGILDNIPLLLEAGREATL